MSKDYQYDTDAWIDDVEGFVDLDELEKPEPFSTETTTKAIDVSKNERPHIMDDKGKLSAAFQDLSAEEFKLVEEFAALPLDNKKNILNAYNSRAKVQDAHTHTPPPELPKKGDGSYQTLAPYVRMSDDELKTFVKDNWGQYLTAFNPDLEIDAITREQLRSYDKRLMSRLEKLPSDKLSSIIQTTSEKIGRNLKEIPPTSKEIQKARQIINYVSRLNEEELVVG